VSYLEEYEEDNNNTNPEGGKCLNINYLDIFLKNVMMKRKMKMLEVAAGKEFNALNNEIIL